jgi:hypothetical protein
MKSNFEAKIISDYGSQTLTFQVSGPSGNGDKGQNGNGDGNDAANAKYGNDPNTHSVAESLDSLANLFQQLEAKKEELGIADYSISQTTMDNVFLQFAEMQKREAAVGV